MSAYAFRSAKLDGRERVTMRQAIVTLIFGVVGALIAQQLNEINAGLRQREQTDTLMYWITDFSNGDVLAIIEILLICYLYARVREVQRLMPPPPSSGTMPRIFGF